MAISMSKGHTPKEEELLKRDYLVKLLSILSEENNFVKFNAIVYLLNDFFVAETVKGKTDLKSVDRTLKEATKQMLEWVRNRGIKYLQVSVWCLGL
jgi:hypothetical protein